MEQSVQNDRVAAYLDELRPHLDDLDPSERAEVLDELADALREVAAEHDEPLRDVLGPPADYVDAYRASAGLEPRPRRRGRLAAQLAAMGGTARAQPWWPHASALARLLRPSWWTLRGGVLAVLLGMIGLGGSLGWVVSVPGLLFITAAVAASMTVRDGRHLSKGRRDVLAGANVVAALAVVPLMGLVNLDDGSSEWDDGYEAGLMDSNAMTAGQLTKPNGDPVTNIYPYRRDGELLTDVLLFDEGGRPLNVARDDVVIGFGDQEIEIEYERDADRNPITNLYPLQQQIVDYGDDDGTPETRRPRTAPTIVLPPSVRSEASEAASAGPEASEPAAGVEASEPPVPDNSPN